MKSQKPKITASRSEWLALAKEANSRLEHTRPQIAQLTVDKKWSIMSGLFALRRLLVLLVPKLINDTPGDDMISLRIEHVTLLDFLRWERHSFNPIAGIDQIRGQFEKACTDIHHV